MKNLKAIAKELASINDELLKKFGSESYSIRKVIQHQIEALTKISESEKRNVRREKKIWTKEMLQAELTPFLHQYGKDMLNDFYKYWTEADSSGKLRINDSKQKYFDVSRRLITWRNNNKTKYNGTTNNQSAPNVGNDIVRQIMGLPPSMFAGERVQESEPQLFEGNFDNFEQLD